MTSISRRGAVFAAAIAAGALVAPPAFAQTAPAKPAAAKAAPAVRAPGKAATARTAKNYAEALIAFNEAVTAYPKYARAINQRGIVHIERGRLNDSFQEYNAAVEDYDKALAIDPGNPDYVANRNQALVSQQDATMSAEARAANKRGDAAYTSKDYNGAVAAYSDAIQLEPGFGSAYFSRGVTYLNLNDKTKAEADMVQAVKLIPDSGLAWQRLAGMLSDRGQNAAALADIKKSLELTPNSAIAFNWRGIVYSRLKNYPRAIADYDRALVISPDDTVIAQNRPASVTAQNNLAAGGARAQAGFAAIGRKDWNGAITELNVALQLAPTKESYLNRAVAYENLGQENAAIADYDRALGLDPGYALAAQYKNDVVARQRQRAAAEAARQQAAQQAEQARLAEIRRRDDAETAKIIGDTTRAILSGLGN